MAKAKSKAADKKPLPTTGEEKAKALAAALDKINKDFGKGTIMKLGENQHMEISTVSTGSLNLDLALGVGGLPRGRITEIYGPESSGKTTLALHCVAQVQKNGGSAAFIDAEHALDPVYAKKLGVNIDDLLVSQPDSGEQALSVAEMLLRSGAVDIIVVDSVAALVPQAEIDGDIGASMVGVHARLMSSAMRRLSGVIERSGTVFIFINQLREKVGVVYGNPEVTTGGRALKFYASVRIEVRRGEALKRGTEQYGSRTKCKVVKNKVAPPFKTAEFDMLFGQGISYVGEVLDLAVALEFVEKSGAWFSLDGERIGQGREKARDWLEEHPDKLEELAGRIRANAANLDLSLDENDLGEAGVDTEDDGFDISAELSALDLK